MSFSFSACFAAFPVAADAEEPFQAPENQRWAVRKADETRLCLRALLLMGFLHTHARFQAAVLFWGSVFCQTGNTFLG